jgi:hypothetical protein
LRGAFDLVNALDFTFDFVASGLLQKLT